MGLRRHGVDGGDEYIGDGMHGLAGRCSWRCGSMFSGRYDSRYDGKGTDDRIGGLIGEIV